MEITEVRVKLMENSDDRLQAFCSITFDNAFVVRDLKIIEGTNGPFVAMPSRKLTAHCSTCGAKNHLRAGYCNHCGAKQKDDRAIRDCDGRAKLYADIAHPINSACREMIQLRVIAEYQGERERSQQPGYVSRYDDDYGFDAGEDYCAASDDRRAAPAAIDSRMDGARVEPARIDGTRIDRVAPDAEPRAPHLLPLAAPQANNDGRSTPHQKPPRQRGEFGAGIFD
jgi:stage V sporulation protein G